ncbi:hypothetical protein BCR43DRAFT_353460 [Syncephalastrum racemosum]|uniref:Uncharacterized protein n=1 Tax=Syncephalastrum racemosum TaxID=13706 RepID=A0A1X2H6D6_SYNRA|nr:hypothetical protein BCR43DRAFT_353460 [Syncephalastrum racemosum]
MQPLIAYTTGLITASHLAYTNSYVNLLLEKQGDFWGVHALTRFFFFLALRCSFSSSFSSSFRFLFFLFLFLFLLRLPSFACDTPPPPLYYFFLFSLLFLYNTLISLFLTLPLFTRSPSCSAKIATSHTFLFLVPNLAILQNSYLTSMHHLVYIPATLSHTMSVYY